VPTSISGCANFVNDTTLSTASLCDGSCATQYACSLLLRISSKRSLASAGASTFGRPIVSSIKLLEPSLPKRSAIELNALTIGAPAKLISSTTSPKYLERMASAFSMF